MRMRCERSIGAALDWLTAAAPPSQRGRVIGITFGAATFGMIGGPVIGSVSVVVGTAAAFGAVGLCAVGLAAWTFTFDSAPAAPGRAVRLIDPYLDRPAGSSRLVARPQDAPA